MKIGIFESVFERPSLKDQFSAVADAGFSTVQFHYASAGLESQPTIISSEVVERVRSDADRAGIRIAAVSGTFNMIHPNPAIRAHGLASLEGVAASCEVLGTSIVTLCTGTRSTESKWRYHPDNVSDSVWHDLLNTMGSALEIADQYRLTFAFEPEPANVARDAETARKLLNAMDHPRLKIILDPANIIASDRAGDPDQILSHAFDLLGNSIALAHAKDLSADGQFCAAGTGVVPWSHYRSLLEGIGFEGDIIFHSLSEDDVPLASSLLARLE